jgi:acyl carrier protein
VITLEEFVVLLREELLLPLTLADAHRDLHELAGWDSMHLLWLVGVLERRAGRVLNVVDLFEARSLEQIYTLACSAAAAA